MKRINDLFSPKFCSLGWATAHCLLNDPVPGNIFASFGEAVSHDFFHAGGGFFRHGQGLGYASSYDEWEVIFAVSPRTLTVETKHWSLNTNGLGKVSYKQEETLIEDGRRIVASVGARIDRMAARMDFCASAYVDSSHSLQRKLAHIRKKAEIVRNAKENLLGGVHLGILYEDLNASLARVPSEALEARGLPTEVSFDDDVVPFLVLPSKPLTENERRTVNFRYSPTLEWTGAVFERHAPAEFVIRGNPEDRDDLSCFHTMYDFPWDTESDVIVKVSAEEELLFHPEIEWRVVHNILYYAGMLNPILARMQEVSSGLRQ